MDSDWSLYVVDGTFSGASSRASRAKIFFYICIYRGKLANLGEFGVYRGKVWIFARSARIFWLYMHF